MDKGLENMKKVITRMAPSPTGMIHIGSARTALFNYLFARHHGGEYKLRIEDTDTERNVPGGVEAILEGFAWLGLEHDGDPVFQMERMPRHVEVAEQLLRDGRAYYCYTSEEELRTRREEAESQGKVYKFKSSWRDSCEIPPPGVKPVVRIKAPTDGGTTVFDVLQGEKTVGADALDDFVILRSDGRPTYMFAVVVDDHDMEITHVIRGNEHYNNAFRQKIIYDALGWEAPVFCHIPLILGSDRTKLSKRHGAASIMEYKEMGYLPEAMNNYLTRLGWSHGDDEIFSMEQAIEWFDLEHIQKSPAMFDFDKLNSINGHYIRQKDNDALFELAFGDESVKEEFRSKCLRAMDMIRDRAITIRDIRASCEIYRNGYSAELGEKELKILNGNGRDIIAFLSSELGKITNWEADNIREALVPLCEARGWKMREWTQALRVALTSAAVSAGGVFEIMEILGRTETMERLGKV